MTFPLRVWPVRAWRVLGLMVCLIGLPAVAHAQDRPAELLLEGFCRQGQYAKVFLGGNRIQETVISGPGVLTTRVKPSRGSATVPVLVTGNSGAVLVDGKPIGRLRVMQADDVLVVCDMETEQVITSQEIRPVVGPKALVIYGTPRGMGLASRGTSDAVDWVMITGDSWRQLEAQGVQRLLDAGISIGVRAAAPPDGRAWRTIGPWQVLAATVAGPAGSLVNEGAYEPTYAWTPGMPAAGRSRLMWIGGAVAAGVMLPALMLRRWKAAAGVVVGSGGITLIMALWLLPTRGVDAGVDLAGGRIELDTGSTRQVDGWLYRYSRQGAIVQCPWTVGMLYPQVASARQWESQGIELHCSETGEPEYFQVNLQAGGSIAMMSRSMEYGSGGAAQSATTIANPVHATVEDGSGVKGNHASLPSRSPLATLVPRLYQPWQIDGESAIEGEDEAIQWWGQISLAPLGRR